MNPAILGAVNDSWAPPPELSIVEWAERYLSADRTSFIQGPWRLKYSPWLDEPLRCFRDPIVRDITMMGPSQGGKSEGQLVALMWSMVNSPGPSLWITADDQLAKQISQERIHPRITTCKPLQKLLTENRHDKGLWRFRTTQSTLDISGAQSSTALEQNPYRYVFGDECRKWPTGSLQKIEKRVRTYRNSKTWKSSTPDRDGDEFHTSYMAGNQCEWKFPCMNCGARHRLTWPHMKWDTIRDANDNYDNDAIARTIHYECALCAHPHYDTAAIRRHIIDRGSWFDHNSSASIERKSFRWNALLPDWIAWRQLVEEFLRAKDLLKVGNVDALKIFINESLAEPWEEGQEIEKKSVTLGSYRIGDTDTNEFPYLFMTVDVQAYSFWYVIRGWRKDGSSRLINCGQLKLWEDVRATARGMGLIDNKSRLVFLDARFNTTEVHRESAQNGWTCFMGDDRRGYSHQGDKGKLYKLYSEPRHIDPGLGTQQQGRRTCIEFMFAQPSAQDLLQRMIDGLGPQWEIPADIDPAYTMHLKNEVKVCRKNKLTGADQWIWKKIGQQHMRDCEAMQVVAANMAGVLYEPPTTDAQPQRQNHPQESELDSVPQRDGQPVHSV